MMEQNIPAADGCQDSQHVINYNSGVFLANRNVLSFALFIASLTLLTSLYPTDPDPKGI